MMEEDASGWRVIASQGGFNDVYGTMHVRVDPDGRARCRIETGPGQSNTGGNIHGGFLLALADHAGFIGAVALGCLPGPAVTISCGVTFIAPGRPGVPVDTLVEVNGETGRMIFVRGLFEQEERVIASFELTLRKRSAAAAGA